MLLLWVGMSEVCSQHVREGLQCRSFWIGAAYYAMLAYENLSALL
jgi:hypothetical protein